MPALASWRLSVFALNLNKLMTENQISRVIVDAAIEAHRELGGPGLIEDVYEEALEDAVRWFRANGYVRETSGSNR